MMSDMKTFTVRDLDRAPAVVLAACDRDGEARIRRRDGRIYRLMPVAGPKRTMTGVPDFAARRRQVFNKPLSAAQTRLADEALRGDVFWSFNERASRLAALEGLKTAGRARTAS
jgi:hypothetical protein